MAEIAAASVGGCLIGLCSLQAFNSLRARKTKKLGVNDSRRGYFTFGASPNAGSPLQWMSPVTHLRRDSPSSQGAISESATLTSNMADFSLLGQAFTMDLDPNAYVDLLRKLIAESEFLQNNPRLGVTPNESRVAKIILKELEQYDNRHGGPLMIEELEYVAHRTNLKIVYPGSSDRTTAFVGSHLDVVPADREAWEKDPFNLTIEGDKLFGRGTTDCLGHVALLTCLLKELGRQRPNLKRSIIVVFIAGEEGGEKGVGIDRVVEAGKLNESKNGPVYWVDAADSQPCCGTSGMLSWSLKCKGRLFHSGFPNKGINSIELASEACSIVQQRFYEDFPPHPSESGYLFSTGSHMKPTQIECKKGSVNQICPECTVHGDIRLSPFYDVEDVVKCVEQYVRDINHSMADIPARGPWSKFVLDEDVAVNDNELRQGIVELHWAGTLDTFKLYAGVACGLDSEGHKALMQGVRETHGFVKPYSISGSLPLVSMMKKSGFDIQLCGFGLMSVYHGVNEYCLLSDMLKAYQVILRVICLLELVAPAACDS